MLLNSVDYIPTSVAGSEGIRVVIHDNGAMPRPADEGFNLRPNTETDAAIKMVYTPTSHKFLFYKFYCNVKLTSDSLTNNCAAIPQQRCQSAGWLRLTSQTVLIPGFKLTTCQ
jgi:hypothetical protein